MAPAVTIDNSSDFNYPTLTANNSSLRTLLLAPPSIASHEENLRNVLESHDRSVTDIHMLDRLSAGLVTLPATTYDLIIILSDVDTTRKESSQLLTRDVFSKIVASLKAGGRLTSQDGAFGQVGTSERTEAILAGLISSSHGTDGMVKPEQTSNEAIPLRFGKKINKAPVSKAVSPPAIPISAPLSPPTKRKSVDISANPPKPVGVGFVDFSDDFGEEVITGEDFDDDEDDEDLIDEDTLLTEEDLNRPITIRMFTLPLYLLIIIYIC